ncbi:MAG: C40 family peptidase [Clostridia bacterium]|nr:C40 family peptidase [Clostridia bacterium]
MRKFALNIIVFIILVSCSTFTLACAGVESESNDDVISDVPSEPPLAPPSEGDVSGDTTTPPEEPDVEVDTPSVPEDSEPEDVTPTPAPVSYAYYLSSTTDGLNVRSKASSSSTRLGSINKGDMLSLVSKEGSWYKTVYKEKTAYVSADYVKIVKIAKTSDDIEKVIDVGLKLLGHPYVYGSERYHWGNGKLNTNFEKGKYDCSALMQYMFYKGSGDLLEVTSKKQYYQGSKVDTLKRGDLMFFTNANGYNSTGINRVRHVGMYLGDNYILHTASDYAVIEPISQLRWSYFITAKRIIA